MMVGVRFCVGLQPRIAPIGTLYQPPDRLHYPNFVSPWLASGALSNFRIVMWLRGMSDGLVGPVSKTVCGVAGAWWRKGALGVLRASGPSRFSRRAQWACRNAAIFVHPPHCRRHLPAPRANTSSGYLPCLHFLRLFTRNLIEVLPITQLRLPSYPPLLFLIGTPSPAAPRGALYFQFMVCVWWLSQAHRVNPAISLISVCRSPARGFLGVWSL
jgi:hypothetical protein